MPSLNTIPESDEYIPLNLWIRQDQLYRITKDAHESSTTIYTLIRRIIDHYYEQEDKK